MLLEKLVIKNYKIFDNREILLNPEMNIFVGENDSGKTTILEALSIVLTGKLNGANFDRQLNIDMFSITSRIAYKDSIATGTPISPPSIEIEAYCKNDTVFANYKGTNNSLSDDCPGMKAIIEFDSAYSPTYLDLLRDGKVFDIPVEFYSIRYVSFKGDGILFRQSPCKISYIDTSKKDYGNVVNRFVADNIGNFLTTADKVDLRVAYRNNLNDFRNHDKVKKLSESIEQSIKLDDRKVNINIREGDLDSWKSGMSIAVDDIPFENVGFGSQNTIKVELVLKTADEDITTILVEEPENNLSFGNMSRLISKISSNSGKQIFISTHSSYVANKLGLNRIHLIHNGVVSSLSSLSEDTYNYFKKLPGYDTLRLVLANSVMLVEGPTEEMLLQRAYFDKNGRQPIEDGIDIIVVDSLAFKRYCDIGKLIGKAIRVVTDNDGDIDKNITQKYASYLSEPTIAFFYEMDTALCSVEECVLNANSQIDSDFDNFRNAISKNGSMKSKSKDEVLSFMKKNKTEWSMRVFDFENSIRYPQYIVDAITK